MRKNIDTQFFSNGSHIERAVYNTEVIDAIKTIEKQAFGDGAFDEWVIVPCIRHGIAFIMRKKGKIMAYAMFLRDWDEPSRAYFMSTAVDSTLQGKGYGTSFIKNCLELVKKEGIDKVELTVSPNNLRAIRIYRDKLGFKETGFSKDLYGKGQDRILMELDMAEK